ncbi:MAG: Kae1-associated kinase Bud32 [Candidatus Aenigmatarchaeota archaeon]|nr:MAG: Kae1-associated kinase Bud32 [Candidatus Aenigmarchaeota archaeon]RLJ06785.1 MAG: Kae1-associated kinase Bud32 [Candidatus Aenigmarchaeota archaeon]RLJ07609.1 MAG: Kae1-associated kinase Bud32 [Candidatus Aenigmarchaeota archaeon]
MELIQRGAEAVIFLEKRKGKEFLIKERIKKGYRIPEIDKPLRKKRTRSEVGLIEKARRAGVSVPIVREHTDFKIVMEWIEGKKLKDSLNSFTKTKRIRIYELIGEALAKLHSNGIIHGDLTTSNMILRKNKLYFIDFGLGKISKRIEDQAVDLFLLYEAIEATHLKYKNEAWEKIINVYKQQYSKSKRVLIQMEKIKKRRRYRGE